MRTYTIREAIDELASNAGVAHGNGYCTWICSANLGYKRKGYDDEFAEGKFTTHDESWNTGEFDGETYNQQDFSEWLDDFFKSEFEDVVSSDALALITDKMKEQMFNAWCEKIWSDSANENNYEDREHRDHRIANEIFYSWEHEESPDNVFIDREKDIVIILNNDELNFVNSKFDAGEKIYYDDLCDGCTTRFVNDYNPDWESEEE